AMVRALAPFLIVLGGAALYRALVLQQEAFGGGFGAIPLAVRLQTAPRLLLSYATLPVRFGALSICDDYRLSNDWGVWETVATLAAMALLAAAVRLRRSQPFIALGIVWMLLGLLPVLNVVPLLHYRADRFFYLPLIGWALVAVCGTRALVAASL